MCWSLHSVIKKEIKTASISRHCWRITAKFSCIIACCLLIYFNVIENNAVAPARFSVTLIGLSATWGLDVRPFYLNNRT